MKKLIIWDKETEIYLSDFVSENDDIVMEENGEGYQYLKLKTKSLKNIFNDLKIGQPEYDLIIILAELNWEGKYLQDFYGFQIALELRRKYVLPPIIVVSTVRKRFFEERASYTTSFRILFARGTEFVHLDRVQEKVKDIIKYYSKYPLSIAGLVDMNEMLFDKKGFLVDTLKHLSRQIGEDCVRVALNDIQSSLTPTQISLLNWEEQATKLIKSINNDEAFNTNKTNLIDKCEEILASSDKLNTRIQSSSHNILILEDDPSFQKRLEENLHDHFKKLEITHNAETAIKILEEDEDNTYTGIIADWRLYTNFSEKKYWQIQGYEVLNFAAKIRYISLFALTSLDDRNLHNIRNELGLNIHLFQKKQLESGSSNMQWEMMADTIKQKCDTVKDIINSLPLQKDWDFYKPLYAAIRNTNRWLVFEDNISARANNIADYYLTIIKECWENQEEITDQTVKPISDFGITLIGDDTKKDKSCTESNLENLLIYRRVWLSLWCNKKQLVRIIKFPHDKDNTTTLSALIAMVLNNKFIHDEAANVKKTLYSNYLEELFYIKVYIPFRIEFFKIMNELISCLESFIKILKGAQKIKQSNNLYWLVEETRSRYQKKLKEIKQKLQKIKKADLEAAVSKEILLENQRNRIKKDIEELVKIIQKLNSQVDGKSKKITDEHTELEVQFRKCLDNLEKGINITEDDIKNISKTAQLNIRNIEKIILKIRNVISSKEPYEEAVKSILIKSKNIPRRLCIKPQTLPKGILLEEEQWLKKRGFTNLQCFSKILYS